MEHCPLTGKPCANKKTIHITEIDGGQPNSLDLCEECASIYFQKTNSPKPLYTKSEQEVSPFPSKKMAHDMVKLFEFIVKGVSQPRICPNCQWTLENIKTTGKLGCVVCYDYFEKLVPMVLMNHQKSLQHVGKVPKSFQNKKKPLAQQLAEAEAEMQDAIRTEDYEKAKSMKDKIIALKDQLPSD